MVYASVARGYQSGGIFGGFPQDPADVTEPVRIFVSEAYHDQQESVCPEDASRRPRRHSNLM